MTINEKVARALICTVWSTVFFGLWQKSGYAALFILPIVLLFSGLVVAVQHYAARTLGDKWFT